MERRPKGRRKGENMSNERFTEIWNEAYNIYTDAERSEGAQYNDMQRYLMDCVNRGELSFADKCHMAKDIMETADI